MGQNRPQNTQNRQKSGENPAKNRQKSGKNSAKTCDSCGTPDISPIILRLKPENYSIFHHLKSPTSDTMFVGWLHFKGPLQDCKLICCLIGLNSQERKLCGKRLKLNKHNHFCPLRRNFYHSVLHSSKKQPACRTGYFQMLSALTKSCPPALFLLCANVVYYAGLFVFKKLIVNKRDTKSIKMPFLVRTRAFQRYITCLC